MPPAMFLRVLTHRTAQAGLDKRPPNHSAGIG